MQNNLTPLSIVLFLFALCTSYMFIVMNASTHTYIGDYKFIMFKVIIVISTIALGFFISMFSCFMYTLPLPDIMDYDLSLNHIVQTFLLYLSSVWMALSIALLPFGHTVYNKNSDAVDEDRTSQLIIVQQVVYATPYYIFMIMLGIFLFVAFIAIGHTYNKTPWRVNTEEDAPSGGLTSILTVLKHAFGMRATFGFYFRFDKETQQLEKMIDAIQNGNMGDGMQSEE